MDLVRDWQGTVATFYMMEANAVVICALNCAFLSPTWTRPWAAAHGDYIGPVAAGSPY
jgi:hypothetical protein